MTTITTLAGMFPLALSHGQGFQVHLLGAEEVALRQCDFVEALGVTEIQGYLIGKPMEPALIAALYTDFVRPGTETPCL